MLGRYAILFLISIVLLFTGCNSFEDLPHEEMLDSWVLFDTQNGLVSDSIYCLMADSKGNIWAGTWSKGMMKYDGNTWTNYTVSDGLPGNAITSISEYWSGDIFIGTIYGLSLYDGNEFRDYKLFDSIWITEILPSTSGNIWIGTKYAGLIRLEGGSDYTQLFHLDNSAANTINSLDQSRDGTVWAGTNAGLFTFDDNSIDFGISITGLQSDTVTTVLVDGWGEVWIGDYYSKNITRIEQTGFRDISLFNGGYMAAVNTMAEDLMGNIWIGTIGDGLVRYDGVSMRAFGISDGLPGISILDIAVDKDGSLWFASIANGISKYTPASKN